MPVERAQNAELELLVVREGEGVVVDVAGDEVGEEERVQAGY